MNNILKSTHPTFKGGVVLTANNLYLSNTSIKTFLTCKRKFKYKYIDRINPNKDITNKYLSFGNSIHLALADFNKLTIDKYRTLDNLHNLLRRNWIRDGYESREEEKTFGLWGLDMLTNYYNNPKDDGSKNYIIEDMIFNNEHDYIICGKLDKVYKNSDGKTEIIDYKTSKNISPIDDLQLPLYLMLANYKLGYYPEVVSLYYLPENKKISKEVDDSFIKESITKILDLCDAIFNENDFTPTPNAYCKSYCEHYDICDASKSEEALIVNALTDIKNINTKEVLF